jgi:hypothetical protein
MEYGINKEILVWLHFLSMANETDIWSHASKYLTSPCINPASLNFKNVHNVTGMETIL